MHMFVKNIGPIKVAIETIAKNIIEEKPELEEALFNFIRKIETTKDVKRHLDFLEKLELADEVWITTGDYDQARGLYPELLVIKGEWAENGFKKKRSDQWIIGYLDADDKLPHKKIWKKNRVKEGV